MALLSCWSWIVMNHKNKKDSFEDLPDDVVIDILSRLPAVCVGQSRRVCKRWQGLMSTTSFAELHVEKAKPVMLLKHESHCVHIEEELKDRKGYPCTMRRKRLYDWSPICSCNGLLLLGKGRWLFISNPITGEDVSLPAVPEQRGSVSAFFFHPIKREYAVLFYAIGLGYGWFEMLSLRTRSWRRLDGFAYHFPYSHSHSFTPPAVVCGAMHWVLEGEKKTINCSKIIMRLNLQSEQVDTMPHPVEQSLSGKERFYLVEIEKRLNFYSVSGDSFVVWILMDYEKWDWVKRYSIRFESYRPYDSKFARNVVAEACCSSYIGIVEGDLMLRTRCYQKNGSYGSRRMEVGGRICRKYRRNFDPHFNTTFYLHEVYSSFVEPHVNSIVSLGRLYSYSKSMEWKDFNFPPN